MQTTNIASKSSQDHRKSLFGALRERFGATKMAKTDPRTPKSDPRAFQERSKRPSGAPQAKKKRRIAKTIVQVVGGGGYAEPRRRGKGRQAPRVQRSSAVDEALSSTSAVTRSLGGGVRGGKHPEFGGVRPLTNRCLQRFAPVVTD